MRLVRHLAVATLALSSGGASLHAQATPPATSTTAVPIGAPARPTNAERMATDRYSRSHDYDLVHQDISLGSFRWDSLSFRGRVATVLVALRPGLDSVVLDCGARLRVTRAATPAGAALRTAARGDTLVVYLARPAA